MGVSSSAQLPSFPLPSSFPSTVDTEVTKKKQKTPSSHGPLLIPLAPSFKVSREDGSLSVRRRTVGRHGSDDVAVRKVLLFSRSLSSNSLGRTARPRGYGVSPFLPFARTSREGHEGGTGGEKQEHRS